MLLEQVAEGRISAEEALEELRVLPFSDLGFAKIDNHRELRVGAPEVIYCEGKTPEQIREIAKEVAARATLLLASRADERAYDAIASVLPDAEYLPEARLVRLRREAPQPSGLVTVITGGTSDLPVAWEAYHTAETMGAGVRMIADVGVAGPHRLLAHLREIREADVVIAVAGMEGALASMVAGLLSAPVIACPTSVGYGASFGGLAALLSMMNSCAPGVSVVNIDNGFGAGYLAARISCRLAGDEQAQPVMGKETATKVLTDGGSNDAH